MIENIIITFTKLDLREKFKKGSQKTEKGNREKHKTEEKTTTEIEKERDSIIFANKVRPSNHFILRN